jgi:hypothetical protein
MARPQYVPTDTLDRFNAADFDARTERDLWGLSFNHQSEQDIQSLKLPELPMPAPLPVVVSPQPQIHPLQTSEQMQNMWQSGNGGAPDATRMQPPQDTQSSEDGPIPPSTAPASASAGGAPLPAEAPSPSSTPAAMPTGGATDLRSYARQKAQSLGIDPDIAERVAMSEGGFDDPVRQSDVVYQGQREQSYGPYQLNVNGGLGSAALQQGIDPRNPAHARAAIDFALEHAAKNGWSDFHGAARVGIAPMQGIGTGRTSAIPGPDQSPNGTPITAPAPTVGHSEHLHPARIADAGDPDAWAKCGPVAAYQFALKTGRNPTPAEVEKLAKDAGWTPSAGMAGFQSEAAVLKGLNIAARAEDGVDWDKVITDVSVATPSSCNCRVTRATTSRLRATIRRRARSTSARPLAISGQPVTRHNSRRPSLRVWGGGSRLRACTSTTRPRQPRALPPPRMPPAPPHPGGCSRCLGRPA